MFSIWLVFILPSFHSQTYCVVLSDNLCLLILESSLSSLIVVVDTSELTSSITSTCFLFVLLLLCFCPFCLFLTLFFSILFLPFLVVTWKQFNSVFTMCLLCAQALQLCPTPHDTLDCSPPGSSVHGTLQARILEWVAISSFRGSSQHRNWTWIFCISCTAGRFFTTEPLGKLYLL